MFKKVSVTVFLLGGILVLSWVGVHFFGDAFVSEIKKAKAETVIITPDLAVPERVETVKRYTIQVANSGGLKEMDACTGGFTKMTTYKGLGEKTLFSAHNRCGGDIVLPMEVGDRVIIVDDQEYVVSEIRDTSRTITTTSIADMRGDVLLQTCYYQEGKMKFVALIPADTN